MVPDPDPAFMSVADKRPIKNPFFSKFFAYYFLMVSVVWYVDFFEFFHLLVLWVGTSGGWGGGVLG